MKTALEIIEGYDIEGLNEDGEDIYCLDTVIHAMDEYASPLLSRIEKLEKALRNAMYAENLYEAASICEEALQEGEKE